MTYRKYDDLRIGQTFPDQPAMFHVNEACIHGFRDVLRGAARGEVASKGDIAPPMLAAVYIRPAQNALKGPPGGVHAKQVFQFHCPVKAGDVLSTTLEVLEKYDRKGRRYLVSGTRTTNQQGTVVTTGRIVSIWGKEDA
ncbi:MAG: MaoC family dehydratase [Hyphomicrobiales bacterium]|nr:MaoC family dehydratase [Hyphomicrobiales bacterium]